MKLLADLETVHNSQHETVLEHLQDLTQKVHHLRVAHRAECALRQPDPLTADGSPMSASKVSEDKIRYSHQEKLNEDLNTKRIFNRALASLTFPIECSHEASKLHQCLQPVIEYTASLVRMVLHIGHLFWRLFL